MATKKITKKPAKKPAAKRQTNAKNLDKVPQEKKLAFQKEIEKVKEPFVEKIPTMEEAIARIEGKVDETNADTLKQIGAKINNEKLPPAGYPGDVDLEYYKHLSQEKQINSWAELKQQEEEKEFQKMVNPSGELKATVAEELSPAAQKWEAYLKMQGQTPEQFLNQYSTHRHRHLVQEIVDFYKKKDGL